MPSKNTRIGKRPTSTSSNSYIIPAVVFIAFCLLGLWIFSSSSSVVPSSRDIASRISSFTSSNGYINKPLVSRSPPVVAYRQNTHSEEDSELDAIDRIGVEKEVIKVVEKSEVQEPRNDENSELKSNEDVSSQVQQSEEEIHEQHQSEHDEQMPSEGNGEEGKQDSQQDSSQQMQDENGSNDSQQLRNQPEINEDVQKTIEEVPSEGQMQPEVKTEESDNGKNGEGETSNGNENNMESDGGNVNEKNTESEDGNGNLRNDQSGGDNGNEKNMESEGGNGNEKSEESVVEGGEGGYVEQKEQQKTEEETPNESSNEGGGSTENSEEVQQQQNEDKQTQPNTSEESDEIGGKKSPWTTQADHSDNEKERRKVEAEARADGDIDTFVNSEWELCNITAGPDYIPCLDNAKALKLLHSFRHYEHRERHCPEESPVCLVPMPKGYKQPIEWPQSRDRIWYTNIPHTKLAEVKGHQNWVKVSGDHLTFPGGGTQFIHGALHYINFIEKSVKEIAWGKRTRVILDVGCGVASFGGYLFEKDVIAMSFAPKDEHEAQVQFALERGIPAISAVMGSQRLQFPSKVFDIVHCARCRVPWHADGGTLLLELNRVLRPGGYFVWSATPVYQKLKEDVEIWNAMKELTKSMCWDLVTIQRDKLNSVGNAFFRKPTSNDCYEKREKQTPPMCKEDDDPNAAWYIPLKACMHRVPVDRSERGSKWPQQWPLRLQAAPYWLNKSMTGVYGKPAPDDFTADYQRWKQVVQKSYLNGLGINWSKVRNVMDMRAIYGGFAAALRDMKVWVMNAVNIDDPDTLPMIYERGLFGMYHDWCESFSTYPRTYDLLHADHLFSRIKHRCKIVPLVVEVDRIVRPGGKIIVRDDPATINDVEKLLKSLHWEVRFSSSKNQEGVLCAEKSFWRPQKFVESS